MAHEALLVSAVFQPRFPAGHLVMTQGVDELVRQGRLNPNTILRRHFCGDWGDLDDVDWRRNDAALKSGEERLFSVYKLESGIELWIITEWDRSVTTLMLPSEY